MNSTDAMDALLGPWQDADRGRALHRLSELYYDRKEATKDAITEPGMADLVAWYWKTTRAIIEFYETRGE